MCGIFCLLSLSPTHFEWDKTVYEHLKRRGPNWSQDHTVTGRDPCCQCIFSAHVLHMRGRLTPQPLQDNAGNVLVWNGEIFSGLPVKPVENDTVVVSRSLSSCSSPSEILSVLSAVRGPWAFVYYQKAGDYLWFGRDFFGRRSLLWKFDAGVLTLTSVAAQTSGGDQIYWQEVPAGGVYRIDLKAVTNGSTMTFDVYPWAYAQDSVVPLCIEATILDHIPSSCTAVMNQAGLVLTPPVYPVNMSVPTSLNETETHFNSGSFVEYLQHLLISSKKNDQVNCLIDVLSDAVRKRVQSLPFETQDESSDKDQASVAILFSGGIDSMILAALADRHIPADQPIDLLNVAFKLQEPKKQNTSVKNHHKHKNKPPNPNPDGAVHQTFSPFDVPDRITGRAGLKELQDLNPVRRWNFVEINVTQEELQKIRRERICHLVHPLETVLDDSIGCAVWFAARGTGFIMEDNDHRPFSSSAKVRKSHQYVGFKVGL